MLAGALTVRFTVMGFLLLTYLRLRKNAQELA